ncbi:MAG: AtpZ/AtpI family protein [Candidatus Aminicenantes bacterium]|nr:MAG: AtpZ/AtpI family protein [Candidatus Aminicenantes bacterium]
MFRNKQPWRAETKRIVALSSLGLMLPSSIAVGLILGYFLDKAFGTRPWLLILFFFFGTASGIINLLRGLNRLQDDKKKGQTKENNGK